MSIETTATPTAEKIDLLAALGQHRFFLRNTTRELTDEQAGQRSTVSDLCLGGLIKQQEGVTDTGIPGLNRIPVIGRLFGSTARNRDRTELIVLITPRVISNGNEAKQITDEYQQKFESLRPYRSEARLGSGEPTVTVPLNKP